MPELTCEECGREAPPDAAGWRAELADDGTGDEPTAVAVFCPVCWLREFGPVAHAE
jgi:hypothetical protein